MLEKSRETRLRRWASRLNVVLSRSRARRFHVSDRGGYSLRDLNNVLIAGHTYDLTLDGVENALADYERKLISQPARRRP